ncbi:MAG: hypothetical protein IPN95_19305 [Bacteroidetes bacterium]|nr:hypothetical protein [Bacteroidota bacterium]
MIASVKKHWPADAGAIPTGNSKSITGGKPGGSTPDPKNPKPGLAEAGAISFRAAVKGGGVKPETTAGDKAQHLRCGR